MRAWDLRLFEQGFGLAEIRLLLLSRAERNKYLNQLLFYFMACSQKWSHQHRQERSIPYSRVCSGPMYAFICICLCYRIACLLVVSYRLSREEGGFLKRSSCCRCHWRCRTSEGILFWRNGGSNLAMAVFWNSSWRKSERKVNTNDSPFNRLVARDCIVCSHSIVTIMQCLRTYLRVAPIFT